jgi:hypothetical protein
LQKFEEISKAQLKKLTKIFQLEQRKSEKREEKEVWFAEFFVSSLKIFEKWLPCMVLTAKYQFLF